MNTQNSLQLELHVPDFEKAKKFYGLLGFEVVWERKPEGDKGYLILKNECSCILNFWSGTDAIYSQPYFKHFPNETKRGYGVEIVVSTIQNLAKVQEGLQAKGYQVVEPLTHQPWGLDDFRVEDPFGYYLRLTTPHDITDASNAVD
ncbi:MAG TPA: VOC family protein [Candidatus Saccharimonadales bacterium]|nr:VOC family protein [Candidatus Saccharimonadales bacterium]